MTLKPLAAILLTVAGALGFAATASAQGAIRVTRQDCARLVAHRPEANVTYQPGVDVHGRPVAPADLPGGGTVALPDTIPILITVDLQERFGIPANSVLYEPEAYIGLAEFRFADGAVTFNGRPLTDAEQVALAAACAESR